MLDNFGGVNNPEAFSSQTVDIFKIIPMDRSIERRPTDETKRGWFNSHRVPPQHANSKIHRKTESAPNIKQGLFTIVLLDGDKGGEQALDTPGSLTNMLNQAGRIILLRMNKSRIIEVTRTRITSIEI
jgi:hypothetical protein